MTIKSLKLYNFQAHRKAEIAFAPGITTIKGPTDSGKSAVLRAVRWVCLNDMAGDDFISWGKKEAVAVLDLLCGDATGQQPFRVVRRKGKENVYKLNGEVFKAFGAGKVPDLIEEVLGVNEINFQKQHDTPFWLSSSAPEVSRQLNRVIDLSVIDQSMAKAGAFVRKARERVAVSEERLGEKTRQLAELKSGTIRIGKFSLLKAKWNEHEAAQSDHNSLEGILARVDSCAVERLALKAAAARTLLEKASELSNVQNHRAALLALADQLDAGLRKARPVPDFGPVALAWKQLREKEAEHARLLKLAVAVAEAEGGLKAHQEHFDDVHARLRKVACPLCHKKNP